MRLHRRARTKLDLVREVEALRQRLDDPLAQQAREDARVHREELRAQQEALRHSQCELETSRDRYAELFDFAPVGFAVLDRVGVVEAINLAAAALLGVPRARVVGVPLLVHVDPADRLQFLQHMSRCRRGDAVVSTTLCLSRPAGRPVPVELISKPSRLRFAAPGNHHTAIVDLTERQHLEEERRRAEEEHQRLLREERAAQAAADARERFLAVLGHELRTPLTPILLGVTQLERMRAMPSEAGRVLEMIRRNARHEARLIDDILDVTRLTHGSLSLRAVVHDVHEVLASVLDDMADGAVRKRLHRVVRLEAAEHHVNGDPERLAQVFRNLVSNAVRYTPAGGCVEVTTANPAPGRIVVAVADDGPGIPPERMCRLFVPFEQGPDSSCQGGLGLGLSIAKGLVDVHGGRIHAVSEGPGRGARFTVELPAVPPPAGAHGQPHVQDASRDGVRVLLVEDHADSGALLDAVLTGRGYRVYRAGTVADALAVPRAVDVLLTDVALPDGSGHDLLRHLRATGWTAPAVAMSGYGTPEDVRRSLDAGFVRHLVKPIDDAVLLDAIERLAPR